MGASEHAGHGGMVSTAMADAAAMTTGAAVAFADEGRREQVKAVRKI